MQWNFLWCQELSGWCFALSVLEQHFSPIILIIIIIIAFSRQRSVVKLQFGAGLRICFSGAEDVGKQSLNFMGNPAVIDFSQSIRPEQIQKNIKKSSFVGKKSSKLTKPSENQPSDGKKKDIFVHVEHVELSNINSA